VQEQTLPTGRDGNLHARLWSDGGGSPLGLVTAVHGLGDHSERFGWLAEQLCAQRYALFAFDLQGHGRSPGGRGRVESYDSLLADIAAALRTAAELVPDVPHLLLGHSMGGNLALNYVLRASEFAAGIKPAGLALISPMILPPNPPQRAHVLAAWLTGHLLPWLSVRKSVAAGQLTRDAEHATAMAEDPLTHSRISLYLATQLLSQGRWAIDHAREVALPTLIMHGDDDELIDRSACENIAVRIGPLASYVAWPDMRHNLFHDLGREEVVGRLCQWLGEVV
jgi:alpha-beta hydrolase superfamily lysophospholipase